MKSTFYSFPSHILHIHLKAYSNLLNTHHFQKYLRDSFVLEFPFLHWVHIAKSEEFVLSKQLLRFHGLYLIELNQALAL